MSNNFSNHALISKYDILPNKKLGQNFLIDNNICKKIADVAKININELVVEVGPGTANLTRVLLERSPKLISIEADKQFEKILNNITSSNENFSVIYNDALKVKLEEIINLINKKYSFELSYLKIVANLPYNIATKLILKWLENIRCIKSMTIMIQKEVADRIIAKPNSKIYGRLSIISQILCNIERNFNVKPDAFFPSPKVDSSVITLTPKSEYQNDSDLLMKIIHNINIITHIAFSNRRKMLRSYISSLHPSIFNILEELEIDLSLRAENICHMTYFNIAKKLPKL